MVKLKKLVKQTEFQLLLFCLYFALICLPYLVFQGDRQRINMYAYNMFEYFFIVWGIVIAILVLISRNLGDDATDDCTHGKGGN